MPKKLLDSKLLYIVLSVIISVALALIILFVVVIVFRAKENRDDMVVREQGRHDFDFNSL